MLEDGLLFQSNFVVFLVFLVLLSHFLLRRDITNFRRLSLRFHPERATTEDVCDGIRKAAFASVAEAYEVLKDPLKRAVYDQYGGEGLKNGVRVTNNCVPPYTYHGEPLRTYREFFGSENPYADLLDHYGKLPIQECPDKPKKIKDDPVTKALPLSLKEIYFGGIKKMKIQQLVLQEDGKEGTATTKLVEKILSIPIMPGIPSGTKIVFPEHGDQAPTRIPADIIFVTEDKPHDTYKREGSDLRLTKKIFLSEALNGIIVTLSTIDGRTLRIPITSVISPNYEKVIVGEGLPRSEDREQRGNLIIDFEVEFPTYLSPDSRRYVSMAFETEAETDMDPEEREPLRRMVFDGKVYMRADKLVNMCTTP